jgi:hypothetical protein
MPADVEALPDKGAEVVVLSTGESSRISLERVQIIGNFHTNERVR